MTTAVQATEHIIVESATAVVTQVAKSTAADLKEIESNAAKEAVSATDENASSLSDKVQDGLQDVATEVVKGAEAAVVTVEQHPELIAEGALAVVIGAASLIQPELVGGEVAIIGKMAADSAKKTVTTIATDTSSKVVKAISKDLADDAKKEAAKDAVVAAAKEKAEDGEKGDSTTNGAADLKGVSTEPATTPANADANISPPTDIAPKDTKVAPTEPVKEAANGSTTELSDVKAEPEKPVIPKDRTIAIEVAQEPPNTTNTPGPSAAAPVTLKITLGPDGEVKAVTKDATEDKPKVVDPAPIAEQVTSKTSSVEKTTKTAVVTTKAAKDGPDATQEAPASVAPPSTVPVKETENFQEVQTDSTKSNPQVPQEAPTSVHKSSAISAMKPEKDDAAPQASVDTTAISSPAIVSAIATVTSTTKTKTISKPVSEDITAVEGKMVTVSQESLDLLHQKLDTMHEAIQQITKVLAFHLSTPTIETSGSQPNKSAEDEIQEALASAVKPLTDLLPSILPNHDDTTHPPLEDPSTPTSSPKRPVPEKRTSVLGVIGKVFWPFGSSEKIATVTVTEVRDGAEIAA